MIVTFFGTKHENSGLGHYKYVLLLPILKLEMKS